MSHRHPKFPRTLVAYTKLPGEYGRLDVIAQNGFGVRLQLTNESVDLNRNDVQEAVRVLTAWLAQPVSRVHVDTDGGDVVVVDRDGDGSPDVIVVDGDRDGHPDVVVVGDRPADASHVVPPQRRRPT